MKNQLYIFILLVVGLVDCNPTEKEGKETTTLIKKTPLEIITTKEDTSQSTIDRFDNVELVERFFPKTKESVRIDTLIQSLDLEISIVSSTIDSYVVNEFESEGIKYIDKYRDYQNCLIIQKDGEKIVDTVFTKKTFSEFTSQEFLDNANFHGYWVNKVTVDTIEFFGVISKPETDWTFPFYHYVDLKTSKFTVKEYINEGI